MSSRFTLEAGVTGLFALAVLFSWPVAAQVVYCNDFTTRSSARPIPNGDWETTTYLRDTLLWHAYTLPATGFDLRLPWSSGEGQDGWAKANINSAYVNNSPGFYAVSPWDLAESGRALMDNIEVRELEGLTVIFR